jgi:hypothetical protein
MNSLVFLQFELGRAQAQLAESLADLPVSSPIGAEIERCDAIAPQRRQHLMERSFANAANRHGFQARSLAGLVKHSIQDLLIATVQKVIGAGYRLRLMTRCASHL